MFKVQNDFHKKLKYIFIPGAYSSDTGFKTEGAGWGEWGDEG